MPSPFQFFIRAWTCKGGTCTLLSIFDFLEEWGYKREEWGRGRDIPISFHLVDVKER
jgi:hypothetical protein